MEKAAAAAALVLPMGYRFLPTDEEVILYLRDETMTIQSISLGFIHEVDLYTTEPWKLWELFSSNDVIDDGEDDEDSNGVQDCLYFFTPLKKKTQNRMVDRKVVVKGEGSTSVFVGTWKFQIAPVDITDSTTRMPVGVKKEAVFVPAAMEDNEDDTGCSSKKRLKQAALEEMQGISYIMHEYSLCSSENQIHSLCKIRRKMDKQMIKNKKMRISNTTTTCCRVAQPDEEENNISSHNDGLQQQQQQQVQISEHNEGSADIKAIAKFLGLDEEILSGGLDKIDEFLSSCNVI